jgi:hypothetical protein
MSSHPFLTLGHVIHSSFGVAAALLAGVLGALVLILISGNVGHPSESEMREALERELDGFVTPGTLMCGLVPTNRVRSLRSPGSSRR